MKRKINCKHGLDRQQEVQSRRLRTKLEQGDREVLAEYKKFWQEWFINPRTGFAEYLQKKDMVYYSAYMRAAKVQGMDAIYSKITDL